MSWRRLAALAIATTVLAAACGSSATSPTAAPLEPASAADTSAEPPSGEAPDEGALILVELIDLRPQAAAPDLAGYLHDLDPHLSQVGAEFLGSPIEIVDPLLNNRALPSEVVELNTDFVVMMRFDDIAAQQSFELETASVRSRWEESLDFDLRVVSVASFGLPLPGTQPPRPAPAFYLVNMFGPQSPQQQDEFLAYVSQAAPMAASKGTAFFDGLVFVDVLDGTSAHVTIGLTEWTSLDTFNEFHNEPGFLALVEQRNEVVTSFVEAGGVARADLLPQA